MLFNRILVPLDGSRLAETALPHAARLARANGTRVLLLRVLEARSTDPEGCPESIEWRLQRIEALRYLDSIVRDRLGSGIKSDIYLTEGRPAEQICKFVREHDVDLVVLSAYGTGGQSEFPFGSTTQKILWTCGGSHLVVRQADAEVTGEPGPYRRILVPLDGSQRSEWAIHVASRVAGAGATEIVLLQIVPEPAMPRRRPLTAAEQAVRDKVVESNLKAGSQYLNEVKMWLGRSYSVQTRQVVSPHVVQTICEFADHEAADLIVLADTRASGINGWGQASVSNGVLAAGSWPVLSLHELSRHPGQQADTSAAYWKERKLCTT